MAFVGDAFRFVTSTVDSRLVTPVAHRLANSVANPYVLSYFLWDRVKRMTPQRARDLTRLLSIAVANGLGVLGADEAKQLAGTARRLQDEVVAATVTREGKDVVLNTVATASKVAQALNTPETKIATLQLFETIQSFIDFFASENGRKVLQTAGECVTKVCEVAASPESAVLLAEVATNICHALEVEAIRREADAAAKEAGEAAAAEVPTHEYEAEEDKPGMRSSLSSAEDTAFETESNMSDYSLPSRATMTPPMEPPVLPAVPKVKERSALRSARIEKDVLLKMGVNPSMLDEVQRILDRLHEDQRREEAAANLPVATVDEEAEMENLTDDEDAGISSAFGVRSSSLPLVPEPPLEETKTEEKEDGVILPEWHPEPVRAALRRRHVAAEEQSSQRHTFEDQSREMTELLARRRISHGDLQPSDVIACRVISQILIVAFAMLLVLLFVSFVHSVLA